MPKKKDNSVNRDAVRKLRNGKPFIVWEAKTEVPKSTLWKIENDPYYHTPVIYLMQISESQNVSITELLNYSEPSI